MGTKLLLVVQDLNARTEYQRALESLEVQFDTVENLTELHGALLEAPYNGLLLDVSVMARASRSDKALVGDLLDLFPVVRLSWDAHANEIRSLFFGQTGGDPVELEDFVQQHCQAFNARCIRRHVRRAVHLNILVAQSDDLSEVAAQRTNSLDISVSGCFLYSTADWQDSRTAWLQISELADSTPIAADIRWHTPWGTAKRLPGIGLEFRQLTSGQLEEIDSILFPK
jgi:hypothetical protein